jgi:hypothetical protein
MWNDVKQMHINCKEVKKQASNIFQLLCRYNIHYNTFYMNSIMNNFTLMALNICEYMQI